MKKAPNKNLSAVQIRCLRDVQCHGDPFYSCRGRAEHCGRTGTIASLNKRGLLKQLKLTPAGVAFLEKNMKQETNLQAGDEVKFIPAPVAPEGNIQDFIDFLLRDIGGNVGGPREVWTNLPPRLLRELAAMGPPPPLVVVLPNEQAAKEYAVARVAPGSMNWTAFDVQEGGPVEGYCCMCREFKKPPILTSEYGRYCSGRCLAAACRSREYAAADVEPGWFRGMPLGVPLGLMLPHDEVTSEIKTAPKAGGGEP